ncbi:MAG: hypothetical protein KDD47_11105 [Acidobacteria bacterium]|nr:hypothetical protein [Acidobacteriota bacterium]
MAPRRDPEVLARMQTLFDLYETAEQMQLQRLRREHPDAGEAEIKAQLIHWLHTRKPAGWMDAPPYPGEGKP